MPRAIWKGSISFGLVNVPVGLYSASQETEIDFDWLDKRSMDPVGYKRINKRTGREIERANIVKGIKQKNGRYVVLDDDEVRAALPKSTQTIDIEGFVGAADIPRTFFEKPYHLAPEKGAAKVYALLRDAIAREELVGIARIVMHNKEHLAALLPLDDALVLMTLRWSDEIRPAVVADGKPPKPNANELKMATQLIRQMTTRWRPERYKDQFSSSIRKLVARKAKAGKEKVVEPLEEAPSASNVIDLTKLLQQSLKRNGRRPARAAR